MHRSGWLASNDGPVQRVRHGPSRHHPPPRASSQARIDSILAASRALLAEQGVAGLSIYSVAERAGLPPSSVYHFFPGVAQLLEALIGQVHAAFRDCLAQPIEGPLTRWQELSRVIELRMLAIYAQDPAARQLILAQHGLAEVTRADLSHDIELGKAMRVLFEQRFVLPRCRMNPTCSAWRWSWATASMRVQSSSTDGLPSAWPRKACGYSTPISGFICRRFCLPRRINADKYRQI